MLLGTSPRSFVLSLYVILVIIGAVVVFFVWNLLRISIHFCKSNNTDSLNLQLIWATGKFQDTGKGFKSCKSTLICDPTRICHEKNLKELHKKSNKVCVCSACLVDLTLQRIFTTMQSYSPEQNWKKGKLKKNVIILPLSNSMLFSLYRICLVKVSLNTWLLLRHFNLWEVINLNIFSC